MTVIDALRRQHVIALGERVTMLSVLFPDYRRDVFFELGPFVRTEPVTVLDGQLSLFS